jgi:RAT1-interacting protein
VSPPGREDKSPPRKRPRTRAPPKTTVPSTRPPTSTKTADFDTADGQAADTATEASPLEQPPQLHTFPIQPLHRFKGASASIKRPSEVAHFSYDSNHEYRADDSSINYYVPPPIGADLKEGFDTFRHHEDKEDAHLEGLLRALVDKERGEGEQVCAKAGFLTWRGMMTKVR